MTLLDEHGCFVYDEPEGPSAQLRETIRRCGPICSYATENVLYTFDDSGTLSLFFVEDRIRPCHLPPATLDRFQRDGRAVFPDGVVRDVGGGIVRVYLDDTSFCIPKELLYK